MAKKDDVETLPPRLSASLGDALRARGLAVGQADPVPVPPQASPPGAAEVDLGRSAKLVLRRERKGHGGKTVTVVEGLSLPAARLEGVAQQMRRALGCGSWIDTGRIVLQGDVVRAAEAWLRAHGATRLVRGN